jgi:hypothetical protein
MKHLPSAVALLALLSGLSTTAVAEPYIGILLDGYQKDCTVLSKGEEYPCMENRQLYTGDQVTKAPDLGSLKIKWAPYAEAKRLDSKTLVASFSPPTGKGMVQAAFNLLGFVRTTPRDIVLVSRGKGYGVPRLGRHATALPGRALEFAGSGSGSNYLVVSDSKGREIFRRSFDRAPVLVITPESIGMRPGEVYTWSRTGAGRPETAKLTLLDPQSEAQVSADLATIDREKTDRVEKQLNKAMYLQLLSEASSGEIDLYWLSFVMLREIDRKGGTTASQSELVGILLQSYQDQARGY